MSTDETKDSVAGSVGHAEPGQTIVTPAEAMEAPEVAPPLPAASGANWQPVEGVMTDHGVVANTSSVDLPVAAPHAGEGPEHRDLVIIGSGPAGLTAAIYAARANLTPLVFEGLQPGGQLTITTEVENYPGFAHPIEGPALMDAMREQAINVGSEVRMDLIVRADLSARPFVLETSGGDLIAAQTLIIATGASAKWIGLESERVLQNRGVSACATCDGFFFRGKDVIVVGGGDTAMEEALYLTRLVNSVTVVHRRDSLRASKIMADRALKHEKIRFVWDSVVDEVLDVTENRVTGVRVRNILTGQTHVLPAQGLFVAIGHQPNTALFAGQLPMDDAGYLITDADGTGVKTPITGVYAAGDVHDRIYRQAITAAGEGCMAAIEAIRLLEAEE